MNIYTTFENSLVDTITSIFEELNIDCVATLSHQNGVEPPEQYCSINTLRLVATGRAESDNGMLFLTGGKTMQHIVRHYEAVVQLNFFGDLAPDNSMEFWHAFSGNTKIREFYLKNKLAPRRISDMRRNPQMRETTWVDSFAFDLTLGFAVQTAQEVDWADYIVVNDQTIPLI